MWFFFCTISQFLFKHIVYCKSSDNKQQYTNSNTQACFRRSYGDTLAVRAKHWNLSHGEPNKGVFWLFCSCKWHQLNIFSDFSLIVCKMFCVYLLSSRYIHLSLVSQTVQNHGKPTDFNWITVYQTASRTFFSWKDPLPLSVSHALSLKAEPPLD